MMRGGFIGFVTGLLPGVGGAVGDFLAYGSTVARHPKEKFGNGNPLGLLGCEGANNAQKVSSMIPTVLFGIPAAPFAAIMMSLCLYFGIAFHLVIGCRICGWHHTGWIDQSFLYEIYYKNIICALLDICHCDNRDHSLG